MTDTETVKKVAEAMDALVTKRGGFVDWEDIARAAIAAVQNWRPFPAPTLERVLVSGWQPPQGSVRGYWWAHEDETDEAGRPIEHPDASKWLPFPLPPEGE